MSTLDLEGSRLLDHYVGLEGGDALGDVPPATAQDADGRLELRVDAARRVVGARVLDPGRLRRPDDLARAVARAYAAADAARGLAALDRSGATGAWLDGAEALRTGTRRLDRGTPPDLERLRRLRRGERPRPRALRASGRSDNGYLEVVRDARGDVVQVIADPEWLSAARPEHLQDALTQAFAATTRGVLA